VKEVAKSKRVSNDLTHLTALFLWALCFSTFVSSAAMLWAAFAAESFKAEVLHRAQQQGVGTPYDFDAGIGALFVMGVFAAILSITFGFAALAIWRSARLHAKSIADNPPAATSLHD
jgi:hypothetical protein